MANVIGSTLNRGINAVQTAAEFFAGSNNFVAYTIRPTNPKGLGLSGFNASIVLDTPDVDPAGNNRVSVYLFEKFLATPEAAGDFLSVNFIAQRALFSYEQIVTGRIAELKDMFLPAFPLFPNEDYSLVFRFEPGIVIAGSPQLRLTPYGYPREEAPTPFNLR